MAGDTDALRQLAAWKAGRTLLGVQFAAAGGGVGCLMRASVRSVAPHRLVLRGESANLSLWLGSARFEYGPMDFYVRPTLPAVRVTGLHIWLKHAHWAFLFELQASNLRFFEEAERALEDSHRSRDQRDTLPQHHRRSRVQ